MILTECPGFASEMNSQRTARIVKKGFPSFRLFPKFSTFCIYQTLEIVGHFSEIWRAKILIIFIDDNRIKIILKMLTHWSNYRINNDEENCVGFLL